MTFYYCSSSPLTELQPCWADLPRRASQRCENCWQLSGAHGIPWNPPKSLEQKIDTTNMDKHFKNWEFVLPQCLTSCFSREAKISQSFSWFRIILDSACSMRRSDSELELLYCHLSPVRHRCHPDIATFRVILSKHLRADNRINREEKDKFDQDPWRSIEVCFPKRCSIKIGCCLDFRRSCKTLEMSQSNKTVGQEKTIWPMICRLF